MVFGFNISILVAMFFMEQLVTTQVLGFLLGGVIIVVMGMVDDITPLSAKVKLIVQLSVAILVVKTGTTTEFIYWPVIQPVSPFFTVIWIVGIVNAVNIIDGIDGLAAGVTAICSSCIAILCLISGTPIAVIFSIAIAGSSLGFLPRNFSPAEIFMGDTGSTFLGYVLAVSSVIGVFKSYTILSIVIATFAIALPILDTTFAMLRRFLTGKPIMQADRGHLHHRLIDKGLSHKQTVVVLYTLSFFSAIIAVLLALRDPYVTFITLIFVIVLMSIVYVYRKRLAMANK